MMKPLGMKVALLASVAFLACACAGGGSSGASEGPGDTDTDNGTVEPTPDCPDISMEDCPDDDGSGTGGGDRIVWGPRVGGTDLSPIEGAEDIFGPEVMDALVRAARATPRGSSQSSVVEDGQTADEVSASVVRDDNGSLVYEVTDRGQFRVAVSQLPGLPPRQEFSLALFTDLIPDIEPDLTSYPHEVLGVWAWEIDPGEFRLGAFWDMNPSIPMPDILRVTGTATYEGDAVGLHAASGATATTKFAADVELVADFGTREVSGEVDNFRSIAGPAIGGGLSVTLDTASFSGPGDPFSGDTTAAGLAGSGKWGARWSDGAAMSMMGGTFGFAADDASVAVLGAFSAGPPAGTDGGDPDTPVVSNSNQ